MSHFHGWHLWPPQAPPHSLREGRLRLKGSDKELSKTFMVKNKSAMNTEYCKTQFEAIMNSNWGSRISINT